ncbi:Secreted RxLR effector peptide protein [Phytophthora palmivora]|uniref:RxLR effector protein n=1 Tax=Phytophthora palmivora TaxID=4796 RepID=A0A2P4XAH1_9STRA|nr:Secreted RxLR effector peptide protein [Phytophthora palmivora]
MRLFNTTLVVLAAVLIASGTAVSKAGKTSVLNVDVVHSSHVPGGEGKRFLRNHQTTDDEGKFPEHDEEERKGGANLFAAFKLEKMATNDWYRYNVFRRWKRYDYSVENVKENKAVSAELAKLYAGFRQRHG